MQLIDAFEKYSSLNMKVEIAHLILISYAEQIINKISI